jgi:eukaryotic-like serine/threonine-protein kinase
MTTTEHVKTGDVLAGKFRVEKVLGEGGMGVVVAARNLHIDQRVAIKFLRASAVGQRDLKERFAREARAATRLKNEHVARVLDVGAMEDGAPYIVMEHLDGCDLAVLLRQRGRLPVAEAVDYVLQACEAIAEAHAAGIIHRDLKPGNLFVTTGSDGLALVKLLDFGISKVGRGADGTQGSALTSTTELLGSPLYMSPEQLQSTRDVGVATDIWGLGVVLYELVAGAPPFAAESMPQLCAQIMIMPHAPLAEVAPDVHEGLRAIVDQCLEKEAPKRFRSVVELAHALAAFTPDGARRSSSIRRIARADAAPEPPPFPDTVAASMSWGHTLRSRSRRGVLFAVLAGALGLTLGVAAVVAVVARGPLASRRAAAPAAPVSSSSGRAEVAPPEATSLSALVPSAPEAQPPETLPLATASSRPAPPAPPPRPKPHAAAAAASASPSQADLFSTQK